MKISNNVNNTSFIITKNASKVQEEKRQTNEKRTAEQSVKLSISNEGRSITATVYNKTDRKPMMMYFSGENS
ncbi:hypothetical protein SAMN04487761_13823 [Lachnospiraceae bacterium C7]|nr:hypothetical protein SAMN04487761_13823 [Lachnospiraceae bacterium C7]